MAGRKKIALCLEYPLALRGGVSVLVETLLQGLADQYELALVSPDSPGELAGSPLQPLIRNHLVWNPALASSRTARELARGLAAAGVHLAHFHFGGNFGWGSRFIGRCPIPWAARLGIPLVSTIHSFHGILDGYCGPRKPFWFKLALLPFASIGKAHVLWHLRREIAVSQANYRQLRRLYLPFNRKFLQIYHSRIKPGAAPAAEMPRAPRILNVGHIAAIKGQVILAEAFARIAPRHPEWTLNFVGHLAEESAGRQIADIARTHRLEGRIQLGGESPQIDESFRRAAIYVQPSLSEALGLALQEAMFHGCAAIGSRTGGIPELLTAHQTGLLVEPGNPADLAEALDWLISNPQARTKYALAGAASIVQRGMTAPQMVAKHLDLYESILHRG